MRVDFGSATNEPPNGQCDPAEKAARSAYDNVIRRMVGHQLQDVYAAALPAMVAAAVRVVLDERRPS